MGPTGIETKHDTNSLNGLKQEYNLSSSKSVEMDNGTTALIERRKKEETQMTKVEAGDILRVATRRVDTRSHDS